MAKQITMVLLLAVFANLAGCANGSGRAAEAPTMQQGGGQNMDYIYRSPSYQISHMGT